VAIVISNYNGVIDGVTLTLNDLMEWLEARGVPCMVLSIEYGEEGEFQDSTKGTDLQLLQGQRLLPCTKYKYRTLFSIPQQAFDILEAFAPTVVHVASPCNLCKAVLEWARPRGIGRIGTFHTDFAAYMEYHGIITGMMEPAVWWAMRWFYSACTKVFAPTVTMVRRLADHDVGLPAHTYRSLTGRIGIGQDVHPGVQEASEQAQQPLLGVWGRGVDLNMFTPSRRSNEFRRKCGVGPQELMIITVSRMVREKNLSTLAGIANSLTANGIAAKLVVVGDGPERDSMAAACPEARFLGALYGDELGAAYASGDVFLFVSDTETFGRVNIEAMASGLPVVAAGAGGTLDIVREGVDGFLVPPRKPEEYMRPLKCLLGDPALRAQMGAAALERSRTYDWELLFEGLLDEYKIASLGVYGSQRKAPMAAEPLVAEPLLAREQDLLSS
jgi:glycosyltransferase involved in cell wall biosynthesis